MLKAIFAAIARLFGRKKTFGGYDAINHTRVDDSNDWRDRQI